MLSHNARMLLQVFEKRGREEIKIQEMTVYPPIFDRQVLAGLPSRSMLKVTATLFNGVDQFPKNVHVYTKQAEHQ